MSITVLVTPSGLKESLGVKEVTEAITPGVRRAMPRARILRVPMVDGGEGFTQALVEATSGTMRPVSVTGPIGECVPSFFGFLGRADPRIAHAHRSN